MKSLVSNETIKQVNENGAELKLETVQTKQTCEYITKKQITVVAIKVSIDKDTFKSAIGGTLSKETYYFQYTGSQWNLYDIADNVTLADYGITIEGTSNNGDRIYVYCDTTNNIVKETKYDQSLTIFNGTGIFNYVNISCDSPLISFSVFSVQPNGIEVSVYGNMKIKSENFLKNTYSNARIKMFALGDYGTSEINIIVAKVV